MSRNLKVNARSQLLEFKRKHNLLVDEVSEVEGDIPTNAEITELAKQAIQADKDILSQITIEYDETNDKTKINFPDNIFVLSFRFGAAIYNAQTLYVLTQLGHNYIVKDDKTVYNSGEMPNQKLVIFSGNLSSYNVFLLDYILANNTSVFTTYYLYHPVTETGTKLYTHNIRVRHMYTPDGEVGLSINFISPDREPITNFGDVKDSADYALKVYGYVEPDGNSNYEKNTIWGINLVDMEFYIRTVSGDLSMQSFDEWSTQSTTTVTDNVVIYN